MCVCLCVPPQGSLVLCTTSAALLVCVMHLNELRGFGWLHNLLRKKVYKENIWGLQ